MNRFIPLLLSLVLLTGCAAQNPTPTPVELPVADAQRQALPFMEVLQENDAAVWYRLPDTVSGFLPLGCNLLFFCGSDQTDLTLVDPDSRQILAVKETGILLSPQATSVRLLDSGISYFNDQAGETVVLDTMLREVSRITAPDDLSGVPLLTKDSATLCYATVSSVRALDIASGISRILREASYPSQELSGLLLEDSVLQLGITEKSGSSHTLFLSVEAGQLLADYEGSVQPETAGSRYFFRQNQVPKTIFFGKDEEAPMVLYPRETVEQCFFLEDWVLTSCRQGETLALDLYELDSGRRTARFAPVAESLHAAEMDADGGIWLLCQAQGQTVLCRWDPGSTPTDDTSIYTAPRYTRQEPDYDTLALCSRKAEEMGLRHGLEILIYRDAAELQPWDYILEYEHDAAVLLRELELLDSRLSNYPAGFLQTLAGKFHGIKLCIVSKIQGAPGSGSVNTPGGIQFWNGYEACIALAAGHDTERTLYHELCHLIDTVVLTESTAYDQWEKQNPAAFQYANSPTHTMSADDWRQAGWESFLDDYSLSYPKEDRARIMEYAMTAGNEERFQSPYLQEKLRLLCTGIREAFGLEDCEDPFLWEQYLRSPLFPNS